MKKRATLLVFLVIPLLAFTLHKYYISLCQIEFVENQQSVQIIFQVFIDDLELTLNDTYKTKLYLASEKEVKNSDDFYTRYLNENLLITLNGKPKKLNFIGKEYDDDIVRFYLEIENISAIKSIQIKNTTLFSHFAEQQNIVKIKAYKTNKTFYCTKSNDKGLLKF